MREVQYVVDTSGKRVAVADAALKPGFEVEGVVYETREEAKAAEFIHEQKVILERSRDDLIDSLISVISETSTYQDEEYAARGKFDSFAREMIEELFPQWRKRDTYATNFASDFLSADAAYREVNKE